jgi:hypothetical protein
MHMIDKATIIRPTSPKSSDTLSAPVPTMDCSSTDSDSSCFDDEDSSVSRLLQQAFDWNEDGVYELASGRSMQAIEWFQKAWGVLRQVTRVDHRGYSYYPVTGRVQIPHLEGDVCYIYPCAVTLCHSAAITSSTSSTRRQHLASSSSKEDSGHAFSCAIVLFNVALAHHQQGKQLANNKELLNTALQYYQECQQLLQSLSEPDDSTQEDLLLLTLAVMNNQAHIEYELQENSTAGATTTEEATGSFQKLWHYSLHAMLLDSNFSMVELSQIHEFVQNAMVFRLERPCAAPTA